MGVDERGQEGSGLLQAVVSVSLCVFCWHGDLVRDCWTTGPPQKTPPFPQMCSSCLGSLCWGARREELHQGWSRITEPACLSGWAYFCWQGLVLTSSQCCHHRVDPFDVLIHWPPHRNTAHVSLPKTGGIVLGWCRDNMRHEGWNNCSYKMKFLISIWNADWD